MATGMSQKHKDLQDTAIRWLYAKGCHVYAKEVPTNNGNADALGIKIPRNGTKETIYYIEAKASRSDLICLKQKQVYNRSIGALRNEMCYMHGYGKQHWTPSFFETQEAKALDCDACKEIRRMAGDTGIDYYYLIVSDGVKVEDGLYPGWGVINESGEVIRRAKRMKREGDAYELTKEIAHVLVYKHFGKIYINEFNTSL